MKQKHRLCWEFGAIAGRFRLLGIALNSGLLMNRAGAAFVKENDHDTIFDALRT